jgi:transposase
MEYVGIDIAKRNHEATILDGSGKELCESFKFANSISGAEKLLSKIKEPENTIFVMEATGHYWLSLYCFLVSKNFKVQVINPIQSDSLRNLYIRRAKTDKKDSFIIADIARISRSPKTQLADERILKLQTLTRLRLELIDQVSALKSRIIGVLDRIFPEYDSIFSDIFVKTSRELLKNAVTPEEILEFDLSELAQAINKYSKGRFGLEKAHELQSKASNSFGITIALDAFTLEVKLLLAQIEFIEVQIKTLDESIKELLQEFTSCFITSIPGIGEVLGATVLAEIGDINRFSNAKKLVAYSGLDATVNQSGQFTGTRNKISKRGSVYLRRALWLAANSARRFNPALAEYYHKKIKEGKHHCTATGAVARKLVHFVYAILKEQKPFDPNYRWSSDQNLS